MNEIDSFGPDDAENPAGSSGESLSHDFIRGIIGEDLASGKHQEIITRFHNSKSAQDAKNDASDTSGAAVQSVEDKSKRPLGERDIKLKEIFELWQ